jgi:hypothetical protein
MIWNLCKKPAILINTLPKSGSMYIFYTLQKGLPNYDQYHLTDELRRIFTVFRDTGSAFPYTITVDPLEMKNFGRGQALSQEHINFTEPNLDILSRYIDRFVVHIRDPRQALLSWVHHTKWCAENDIIEYSNNVTQVLQSSFHDQVNYYIENHFKGLIDWLEGWANLLCKSDNKNGIYVHYNNKKKIKILLTTHQELLENESVLFSRICEFYKLRIKKLEPIKKDSSSHFRQGSSDEWRSVFTPMQIERCNMLMPQSLFDFYGFAI